MTDDDIRRVVREEMSRERQAGADLARSVMDATLEEPLSPEFADALRLLRRPPRPAPDRPSAEPSDPARQGRRVRFGTALWQLLRDLRFGKRGAS